MLNGCSVDELITLKQFCEEAEHIFDQIPMCYMKMSLLDFNAKL